MNKQRLTIYGLLGLLLLVSLCQPGRADDISLNQHWQYRWGDSPFDASGVPLWIQQANDPAWQNIDFPADPPARNGETNVWFRLTLPDVELRDPVFYVTSVDLIVEAYLDGERIYRHGEFDADGQGHFSGWPWHMLTLPKDFAGKTLYLRVFSDYMQIGLWGEVKITDKVTLIKTLFEQSTEGIVAGGLSLLIALLALTFALMQGQRRQFLWISLFCFTSAGLILGDTPVNLLVFEHSLFWNRMAAYAYFLLPVPMYLLLTDWLAAVAVRVKHLRWLWQLHLMFFLGAVSLSLAGIYDVDILYVIFDGFFIASLLVLVGSLLVIFQRVRLEQKVLVVAYLVFCVILLLDMAVAHSWLSWADVPVSAGALVFSLALVALSFRHYLQTQQRLQELNNSLEQKVNERTQQLEALAAKERQRSDKLLFQKHKAELINQAVEAMENGQNKNAALQSVAAQMQSLCLPLGGAFYQQRQGVWQTLQQWGEQPEKPPACLDEIQAIKITAEQAFFPIKLNRADGETDVLAVLMVCLSGDTTEPGHLTDTDLLELLGNAIEKITFTLANIALREELQRYSYEDALTGLKNRRFFTDMLAHEIATAQRNQLPLSLLMCDIDYFKRFNDTHGHAAGDQALITLARLLQDEFRQSDVACRIGGEEFVVIMPQASASDCLKRAQGLLKKVAETPIYFDGTLLDHVTLSIGVASWPEQIGAPDLLLNMADNALYVAKSRGRNQIQQVV